MGQRKDTNLFNSPKKFQEYVEQLDELLSTFDSELLEEVVTLIYSSVGASTIFIAGNGGSHAIASHFGTDLERTFELLGLKTVVNCIASSQSYLTATANDFGYEEIFSRYISRVGKKGDKLFVISSSGESRNIINAVKVAKAKGILTIALTGFEGGAVSKIADISLVVRSIPGAYPIVEDCHSLICHYLSWAGR